jgi:hypothetical protein
MNRFYLAAAIAVAVVVIVPIASRRLETGALESTIAGFLLGLRSQTIESLHRLGLPPCSRIMRARSQSTRFGVSMIAS